MDRPARVLYVTKTTDGGAAFSLFHLANGLDRSRFEPVVLFLERRNPHILERLEERGIPTIVLESDPPATAGTAGSGGGGSASGPSGERSGKGRTPPSRWLQRRLGRRVSQAYLSLKSLVRFLRGHAPRVPALRRAIREHGIDLVHLNDGLPLSKAGIVAARRSRLPCVCHVRMFQELTGFDRFLSRYVHRFVYISRAIAEHYESQGIPAGRGEVVHNAVALEEYLSEAPRESAPDGGLREEYGWNGSQALVGVIGRLDSWKGHEYFIEAMSRVKRELPGVKGLIVGELEDRPRNRRYVDHLRSLVRSLGLEETIVFTGYRRDVPRVLRALDVVVLSSSDPEPFGRVVIEGMAAEKPVVATAAGGVLDVLEDGVTGLLVPCRDAAALGEAILSLLRDPARAARLARAGREHVAERFTVARHVEAVERIYEPLLGGGSGRRG